MICKRKDDIKWRTMCDDTKKNNKGISLVTVIITIVVIIILALIVYYYQFQTTNSAGFSKYAQEYEEVSKSVETVRLGNAKSNLSNINKGFKVVNVSGDIPFGFKSISESGDIQAYLVDLNYIGCDALTSGKDYNKFSSTGGTVYFGVDDVYVYDDKGVLYYTRGYLYNGLTYYEGTKANSSNIRIANISTTDIEGAVRVTITVEAQKDVSSIKVGNIDATKIESGKYQIDINKNGNYEVIALDVEGNKAQSSVSITSIGNTGDQPVVTAIVTNGILGENDTYTITSKTAKIRLISSDAKELYIGNTEGAPTEWLVFSENVERYFSESGVYTLYIYVKNASGISNTIPTILKIKVDTESTKPTFPGETITSGDITFVAYDSDDNEYSIDGISELNNKWDKVKYVKIIFGEGMQSNGYTSSYGLKTNLGDFNYKTVYDKEVKVPIINSNTTVGAKIMYNSDFSSKEIAKSEVKIEKVDQTPPTITSFERYGNNEVVGSATDAESGLSSAPYYISMNYVDFSVHSIDEFTWQSEGRKTLTESGRYYLYAKDNVGNVAVKSINVDAPDLSAPVIDLIKATPEKNYVIIKFIAHDDQGIMGYAIKNYDANTPTASEWINISSNQQISIEYNVLDDGIYNVFVIDNSGNISRESIEVTTFKLPILNSAYPATVRVNEGQQAEFKVQIATDGYPNEYRYEWKVSKNNGATWEIVPKSRKDTYRTDPVNVGEDGYLYKCVVENDRGTIESNIAKLEVVGINEKKPSVISLEKQPDLVLAGVTLNNGADKTVSSTLEIQVFAINAAKVNISEKNTVSDTWVDFENTITYTLNNKNNGNKTIYIRVKDAQGNMLNKEVHATIEKVD